MLFFRENANEITVVVVMSLGVFYNTNKILLVQGGGRFRYSSLQYQSTLSVASASARCGVAFGNPHVGMNLCTTMCVAPVELVSV